MNRGLLLTLTEPPPAMEEEFNAKYVATYELDSVKVLSSPHYLERLQNQTPWTEPHPGERALLLNNEIGNALQVRRFVSAEGERISLCELATPDIGSGKGIVYRRYQP